MKTCAVDQNCSPHFSRLVSHYRKTYPNIDKDLTEAFTAISQDYLHAKHANAIRGYNSTVFKYRQRCSDERRGAKGGWRIIAYYHAHRNVLYPLILYTKSDQEDVDPRELAEAVEEIIRILRA